MNEKIQELRAAAKAREAELFDELTSREAVALPDPFAGVIGELKAAGAREEGRRMNLDTLESLLEESRAFDERLDALSDKVKERRRALVALAAPLAKRALQAMRRGELRRDEAFLPLIETANHISELRKKIDGAGEGEGFWGKGKARAERLMNQGRLKVAQFKLHGGLKDVGKAILKAGDEEKLRCDLTEEELGKVAAVRKEWNEAKGERSQTGAEQESFFQSAAERLGESGMEATDDLEGLHKSWTEDLEAHRQNREILAGRIRGLAQDPTTPDCGLPQVAAFRQARAALDEACRECVARLDNVDWPAVQVALGESLARCPSEFRYLRGLTAFDDVARKDNRKLGFELCERGAVFCFPAAGGRPFVGLADEAIISLELEDMQQIYETRRGNVVADSLIGFVTGGVKGAVMRGASGLKEREVAVEMPDLVLTLVHRDATGVEQAIHLALEFGDKEDVAPFLSRHFGGRFRVIPARKG